MKTPIFSGLIAWIKASRLPSQSYIALPLVFGQALYFAATGKIDILTLVLVQLFGVFDQLYIVYANDYADVETDRSNETPTIFSGGSRVLVDGSLSRRAIGIAAVVAAAGVVLVSVALAVLRGQVWCVPLSLLALALLWAYSFPPIKMSYRGAGELLQTFGVAVVLPVYGYYAQSGSVAEFPFEVLWAIVPTHLACAMATSLPDEPSDRASGKKTATVIFGPKWTKVLVVVLNYLSMGHWVVATGLWEYMVLPAVANTVQIFVTRADPGTTRMSVRTFFAVLVTVSIMATLAFAPFFVNRP